MFRDSLPISRAEQAPKKGFHPLFGWTKVFVNLWDLLGAINMNEN